MTAYEQVQMWQSLVSDVEWGLTFLGVLFALIIGVCLLARYLDWKENREERRWR